MSALGQKRTFVSSVELFDGWHSKPCRTQLSPGNRAGAKEITTSPAECKSSLLSFRLLPAAFASAPFGDDMGNPERW
jgi:hypothetical protein